MFEKLTPTRLSAAIAGGVMLCMSSTANAGFMNMEYACSYEGPISVSMPCGPTVKPDSIGVPLDGHMGIWETYTAPGVAEVTIHMTGTYNGPINDPKMYYTMGFDKDFLNGSLRTFYGFDMIFVGEPAWEPMLVMELPYMDTAGYLTPYMANPGGIWFDGMVLTNQTVKLWAAVMVPLHFEMTGMHEGNYTGTVHGHMTIRQIPKVSEPAVIAIFALGLAGLGVAARRKAAAKR